MLDFSHIPSKAIDRQIFYTIGGSDTWQTWRKPRNAKIVHMFCKGVVDPDGVFAADPADPGYAATSPSLENPLFVLQTEPPSPPATVILTPVTLPVPFPPP